MLFQKKLYLIKDSIKKYEILNYFSRRKSGKGNYYDANFASLNSNLKIKHLNFNTIFLHVFRDSPLMLLIKKEFF